MSDQRTPESRIESSKIRDWAEANGFEVAKSGRIPAGIRSAYEAANPGVVVDDRPDWDQAAAEAGVTAGDDPFGGLEGELAGQAAAATAPPGPPPPASLDEARERLGAGRKPPPWAKESGKPRETPTVKVTKAVISDMEAKLTLLLAPPAAFWQTVDPLCGNAFADNLDNIVARAVPILAQSAQVVGWFTKGTTFLLWFELVLALRPVADAVYAHHVSGTVMLDERGQPVASRKLEDGRVVPLSAAAQGAAPDRSAYTTNVGGHVPPARTA